MVPTWVWELSGCSTVTGRDDIYSRVRKYLSEGRRIGIFLDIVFYFWPITFCSCSGSDFLDRAMDDIEKNIGLIKIKIEVTPASSE